MRLRLLAAGADLETDDPVGDVSAPDLLAGHQAPAAPVTP
jgi:hypothetical protein